MGLGPKKWLAGSGVGGVLGLIMGATSVGAGTLMTAPVLLIFRISADKVVGTTIGVSLVLMVIGDPGVSEPGPGGLEYCTVPEYRSGACSDSREQAHDPHPRKGAHRGAYGHDAGGVREPSGEGGPGILKHGPRLTPGRHLNMFCDTLISPGVNHD